jgi:DNA-directed RNA polymerase subunit RPC12/RpoP
MIYPEATVICQKCDEVIYTTLKKETIKCPCGEKIQVREPGDENIIRAYNANSVGEAVAEAIKKVTPVKAAPKKRKAGATTIAREYYERCYKDFKKGKLDRKEIVNHVINELGVNKGTAGVQWSKFIKSKG